MLKSKQSILAALRSLIAGHDPVTVHNNDRFVEVKLIECDDALLYVHSRDSLDGYCAFSTKEFQFAVDAVIRSKSEPMLYKCALPAEVTHVQKRSFLRRTRKSDAELLLHCFFAGRDFVVPVSNLSLSGVEAAWPEDLALGSGAKLLNAQIKLEDLSIRMSLEYCNRDESGAQARFRISRIELKDFQSLQRLLSSKEVWEPSDFSMYM